jgi:hypothetical protein
METICESCCVPYFEQAHEFLHQLLRDRGVERIDNPLPVTPRQDQLGIFEDAEMVRDAGGGNIERRADFTRRQVALAQHAEDAAARGVGEGLQRLREAVEHSIFRQSSKYQ